MWDHLNKNNKLAEWSPSASTNANRKGLNSLVKRKRQVLFLKNNNVFPMYQKVW